MAGSVNQCILVGNLGQDPEVRSMQNGSRVCNFSIATSESWIDKASGQRKEAVQWHKITIWNDNLVTIAEKYLRKGSKVYIEGALETRKWTDKDGKDQYTTEVVLKQYRGELQLLDSRKDGQAGDAGDYAPPASYGVDRGSPSYGTAPAQPTSPYQRPYTAAQAAELDSEIPF